VAAEAFMFFASKNIKPQLTGPVWLGARALSKHKHKSLPQEIHLATVYYITLKRSSMITKRLIQLLITLFLIAILAIIGLMLFVDPNHYKDEIVKKVETSLDRRFAINGDISWRFWPRLGFAIHDVELGQPKDFTNYHNDMFAKIGQASIYISIAPLLNKEINVDTLSITNAQINLVQLANGHTNWDDLLTQDQKNTQTTNNNNPSQTTANKFSTAIRDIQIENTAISFDDQLAKQTIQLTIDQLSTALQDHANPLTGHFHVDMQPQNLQLDVTMNATFNYAKPLKIKGDLQIAPFTVSGLALDKTSVNFDMSDQILHLAPLTTHLYDGTLTSTSTLNLKQSPPHWEINAKLDQVDLSKLSKTFTGRLNLSTQATASGLDSDSMIKSLNGNAQFSVDNGVYHGLDLGYWLAEGQALLSSTNLTGLATTAIDAGVAIAKTNTQRTEFTHMSGTFLINNGIASNNDLVLENPTFNTAGKGTIHLSDQSLNYALQVSANNASLHIPLVVTGTLQAPHVGIDKSGLQSIVVQTLGTQLKGQLQNVAPLIDGSANTATSSEQAIGKAIKGFLGK
jgi:uncharacterized protein involved in outer membrane biogenesis